MAMVSLLALAPAFVASPSVASLSGAPFDWVLGTAASVGFVAVIAVPAMLLNSRDHKRRQRERSAR